MSDRDHRELHRFRKAAEAAGVGILITDARAAIVYSNPAFTRLSGWESEELKGENPRILNSGTNVRAFYKYMWAMLSAGKRWSGEIINRRKDGGTFVVFLEISPVLEEGELEGYVATYHDISELKAKEKELLQEKHNAEAATVLKDKFLSLVSHDLKGPLGTIINVLRMVNEKRGGKQAGQEYPMLEAAIDSGKKMLHLIEELLSVGRLKTGKLTPQKKFIAAEKLVMGPLAAVYYRASEKGVEIINDIPSDAILYGDRTLLQEVVQNLLSNSLKFCHPGGWVRLWVPENQDGTLKVEDNGEGIPPEQLANLFDYGVRTTTVGTAGEVGTGLGLPLCREIMRAHGGDLRVVSEEGRGTAFSIILPPVRPYLVLAGSDRQPAERLGNVLADTIGASYVIVEDTAEMMAAFRKKTPHLVAYFATGNDIKELDHLAEIKREPEYKDIPFALVCGDQQCASAASDKVVALHVDLFLGEDPGLEKMAQEVRRLLEPTFREEGG